MHCNCTRDDQLSHHRTQICNFISLIRFSSNWLLPGAAVEKKSIKSFEPFLWWLFLFGSLIIFVAEVQYFLSNFVVHGALRCLALLSVDLDDTVVPTLVPALFPCLLKIVSSPQVRFFCLSSFLIYSSCSYHMCSNSLVVCYMNMYE